MVKKRLYVLQFTKYKTLKFAYFFVKKQFFFDWEVHILFYFIIIFPRDIDKSNYTIQKSTIQTIEIEKKIGEFFQWFHFFYYQLFKELVNFFPQKSNCDECKLFLTIFNYDSNIWIFDWDAFMLLLHLLLLKSVSAFC